MALNVQLDQIPIIKGREDKIKLIQEGNKEAINKAKAKMNQGEMMNPNGVITRPEKKFDDKFRREYQDIMTIENAAAE